MKTYKPTMSHNACYDAVAHRWLIAPNDIVIYRCDSGTTYLAYVRSVSILEVEVVRLVDKHRFFIPYYDSDLYLVRGSVCDLVIRWMRSDDTAVIFRQGDTVIDSTFDGSMCWTIDKFDKERGRAFLSACVSGRRIGHWQDLNSIVHK